MELNSDYFKTIQGSIGCKNKKEVNMAEIQKRFARDFDNSIGVVYNAVRNDKNQDFIITKSNKNILAFTRPGEELNVGDIVFCNSSHWLVTDKPFQNNEIYNSGIIIRCNREIKWQNPITKEIISRWCFAERPYATGISEGKVVSVPDRTFSVKLPYDSETIQVDIGKRFVLETINGIQKTYKLEMPDINTNKFQDSDGGLIIWNLKFSSDINPAIDNIELGICDYIEPVSPPPLVESNPTLLRCEIVGRDSIKIGGSERSYTAKFYAADGVTEIADGSVIAKWDISLPAGLEEYFEITQNANSVLIKVSDCEALIGENISLKLSDDNRIYNSVMLNIDLVVM